MAQGPSQGPSWGWPALQRWLRRLVGRILRGGPVPRHIAFIMDGNRRYARQQHLERIQGHADGFKKLRAVLEWCLELGVECVSVYAFSIDNFKRAPEEVQGLMALAEAKLLELAQEEAFLREHQLQVRVVGDTRLLPAAVQRAARVVHAASRHHTAKVLNVCMAYSPACEGRCSSRQEVSQAEAAARQSCAGGSPGDEKPTQLLASVASHLYTEGCPPVDLLVRTSGEQRLSDFMLWQASTALLAFTGQLWPAFSYAELLRLLLRWQAAAPRLGALRAAAAAQGALVQ